MDMHAGATDVPNQEPDSGEALTFDWLYQQVQRYAKHSVYPQASRIERWSFRIGLLAAAIGIIAGVTPARWLDPTVALPVTLVCVCVEIGGFLLGFVLQARRDLRQYTQPRLSHAKEMDADFAHWRELVQRLHAFPRQQREERLRFVSTLRTGMTDRMGMMYGGLQRLGPFPLLIALYLQFRHWQWGDWSAVFDVTFIEAVLIVAMVLLYAVGWLLVGLRVRLDTYVSLLEASLHEGAASGDPAAPPCQGVTSPRYAGEAPSHSTPPSDSSGARQLAQ
ncbi:hypothetical protein [Stenotrophomonas sp. 169]|uniref:hypothetical protein n=1 Tax=Stenotrophomonas sp. 169 TaxID=2770322 RepID=UPI001CB79E85|nr:hypothetical protein [Stenotrophomonas sp. 169]